MPTKLPDKSAEWKQKVEMSEENNVASVMPASIKVKVKDQDNSNVKMNINVNVDTSHLNLGQFFTIRQNGGDVTIIKDRLLDDRSDVCKPDNASCPSEAPLKPCDKSVDENNASGVVDHPSSSSLSVSNTEIIDKQHMGDCGGMAHQHSSILTTSNPCTKEQDDIEREKESQQKSLKSSRANEHNSPGHFSFCKETESLNMKSKQSLATDQESSHSSIHGSVATEFGNEESIFVHPPYIRTASEGDDFMSSNPQISLSLDSIIDEPQEPRVCNAQSYFNLHTAESSNVSSSGSVRDLSKDDEERFSNSGGLGSENKCKNLKNIDVGLIKYEEESQFCGIACTEESVGSQAYLQSVSCVKNDSANENTRVKRTTWESSMDYQPTSDAEQQTSMEFNEDDLFSCRDFDSSDESSCASSTVETDDDTEDSCPSKCGCMYERQPKDCKDQSTQTNNAETRTALNMNHVNRYIYVYCFFQFIRTQSNCLSICDSKKPLATGETEKEKCCISWFEIPSVLSKLLQYMNAIQISIRDGEVMVVLHDSKLGVNIVLVSLNSISSDSRGLEVVKYRRMRSGDTTQLDNEQQATGLLKFIFNLMEHSGKIESIQTIVASLLDLKSHMQYVKHSECDKSTQDVHHLDSVRFRDDEDARRYELSSFVGCVSAHYPINTDKLVAAAFGNIHRKSSLKVDNDTKMSKSEEFSHSDQLENTWELCVLQQDGDDRAIVKMNGTIFTEPSSSSHSNSNQLGIHGDHAITSKPQQKAKGEDILIDMSHNGQILNGIKVEPFRIPKRRWKNFESNVKSKNTSCGERINAEEKRKAHLRRKQIQAIEKSDKHYLEENEKIRGALKEGMLEIRIPTENRRASIQQQQSSQISLLSDQYRYVRPDTEPLLLRVKVKKKSGKKKVICKQLSASEELKIRQDVERFFLKKHEAVCARRHLSRSYTRSEFKLKLKDMSTEHLLEKILKAKVKESALEFLRRSLHISASYKIITVTPVQHQRSGLDGYFQRVMEGEELTYRQQMRYEWLRIKSYWSFPLNTGMSIILLARNGFYFTGRTSECRSVD